LRVGSSVPFPLIPEESLLFWSLGYLALRCLLQIVLLRPRSEGDARRPILQRDRAAKSAPLAATLI
jgi:hypothetical protein